jgi:hypothetical protein
MTPGGHSDVVYGTAGTPGRDLVLRLHGAGSGEQRPGVVLIHGGGWIGGHPSMLTPIANALVPGGDHELPVADPAGCAVATAGFLRRHLAG